MDASRHQGDALGYHPKQFFVPHPIQDRTSDEIEQLADDAFDAIMGMVFSVENDD